ncbi:hypothetical protein [Natranaerobius thermophilus]|uniref:Uncharacterized protein n=1 Tax=Natranaerobius thermophilus (strain ATCC BAA-1301 / DSM 18059 / JW/NM-WN-LF) TaxID=457570 RepID=B2A404_NATTJ|nr:hypothetical protein [Natranaerobius thermophilus]ACB85106.1 hypothetical protein Nther_1526 [Natranaerobius thermophilus JW/NM-WN-LF]
MNYVSEDELNRLEKEERRFYHLTSLLWKKFANDKFKPYQKIENSVYKEMRNIEKRLHSSLVNELKNRDLETNLVKNQNGLNNILIVDYKNIFLNEEKILKDIFNALQNAFKIEEQFDFKKLYLEQNYTKINVIILECGKILNSVMYSFPLYRVLEGNNNNKLSFLDLMMPVYLEDSLIKKLNLEKWTTSIPDLNYTEKIMFKLSECYNYISHVIQFKYLEELIQNKEDTVGLNITQEYINSATDLINKRVQLCIDYCSYLLNSLDFSENNIKENAELQEIFNGIEVIYTNLLPTEMDNQTEDYNIKLNFEEMENWYNDFFHVLDGIYHIYKHLASYKIKTNTMDR